MKIKGIAFSVISRTVIIAVLFMTVSSGIWYYRIDHATKTQFYAGTDHSVTHLAAMLRHPVWEFNVPQIAAILRTFVKDPPVIAVLVTFAIEGIEYESGFINRNGVISELTEKDLESHVLYNGFYRKIEEIVREGIPLGHLYVWYTTDHFKTITRKNLLFSGLSFLLGAFLLYIVLHRVLVVKVLVPLETLQRIMESMQTITPGSIKIINGSQELAGFSRALRGMLEKFEINHGQLLTRLETVVQHEKKSLYQSLVFSTVHDGIIIGGLDGNVIDWNPGAERILGYVKGETIGKPIVEFLPHHPKTITPVIDELGSWDKIIDTPHKNTHPVTIELFITPMVSKEGQRIAFLYLLQDLTKQRRSEAEIVNLARFPEENPNPVLRVNNQLHVLYANSASTPLLEYWGVENQDPIPQEFREPFQQAFISERIQTFDIQCRNGSVYSLALAPITGQHYLNVYGLDITERMKHQEALKRSEERFRQAVDVAPFPIMLHAQGAVITVNKAWQEITGYTADRIPMVRDWIKLAYRDEERSMDELQEIIQGLYSLKAPTHEGVFRITTASGEFRDWDFNTAPIGKIRDKDLVITIVADMTVQLATEERLLALTRSIIAALENVNRLNDTETGEHIDRVAVIAAVLAQAAGCPQDVVDKIYMYAPLHDVGKVGLRDELLMKPGAYSDEEFEEMKQHVVLGAQIIGCPVAKRKNYVNHVCDNCGKCIDKVACQIAFYHHERIDGKGYVCRLKGDEIPLPAKIVTIADVWDALINKRRYKKKFSEEKSLRTMREGGGTQFDPDLLQVFFKALPEIKERLQDVKRQGEDQTPCGNTVNNTRSKTRFLRTPLK